MLRRKNVLIAPSCFDHRILTGISAYAAKSGWSISAAGMMGEDSIPRGWRGDGILAWLSSSDDLTRFLGELRVPTVNFTLNRVNSPYAYVILDYARMAEMAAEHFRRRGTKNLLFYSDRDSETSNEIGSAFVEIAEASGCECKWIKWFESAPCKSDCWDDGSRRAWLKGIIRNIRKPVEVFAATGALGIEIFDICKKDSIHIPRELALIAVEDQLLASQTAFRPITGIDPNFEELGFQGAKYLDSLMNGGFSPEYPIRIAPRRIISRISTDISEVKHAGLAKALSFIAESYSEDMNVGTIAQHAGISRRSLHLAFTQHCNISPGQHLSSVRLEQAKKLLVETDAKIAVIARNCGYGSVNTFHLVFRRRCGVSPGQYRQRSIQGC